MTNRITLPSRYALALTRCLRESKDTIVRAHKTISGMAVWATDGHFLLMLHIQEAKVDQDLADKDWELTLQARPEDWALGKPIVDRYSFKNCMQVLRLCLGNEGINYPAQAVNPAHMALLLKLNDDVDGPQDQWNIANGSKLPFGLIISQKLGDDLFIFCCAAINPESKLGKRWALGSKPIRQALLEIDPPF